MVSSCWTCYCRPMGFVVALLLFLGPLVAQGKVRFRPSFQPAELPWQKHQSEVYHQALKANRLAIDFLSRMHNVTYYRAPGWKTHVMTEMAFGRAFHLKTVLVNASCPEGYTNVDPTDCEIAPDALRLECHLVVILLYGSERVYINEEGCKPSSSSTDSAEEEEPEAEEEEPKGEEEEPEGEEEEPEEEELEGEDEESEEEEPEGEDEEPEEEDEEPEEEETEGEEEEPEEEEPEGEEEESEATDAEAVFSFI